MKEWKLFLAQPRSDAHCYAQQAHSPLSLKMGLQGWRDWPSHHKHKKEGKGWWLRLTRRALLPDSALCRVTSPGVVGGIGFASFSPGGAGCDSEKAEGPAFESLLPIKTLGLLLEGCIQISFNAVSSSRSFAFWRRRSTLFFLGSFSQSFFSFSIASFFWCCSRRAV